MVDPCAIIRAASLAGVGLNLRGGRLHGPPPHTLPSELAATIKAHKPAIIAALHTLATSRDLYATTRDSCPPSATLTAADRAEAETLAADLRERGGTGQFVCDLFHAWNDLSPTDRTAAVLTWQLAAGHVAETLEDAA